MNGPLAKNDSLNRSADEAGKDASCLRRRLLRIGGLGVVGALAGCAGIAGEDTPEDLQFDELHTAAVYVADAVDLSMPEVVETVDAPTNADLLVLPGDVDADAEQVVDWLAADRVVALLGSGAEATWLEWARSDEFRRAFENRGLADSDPNPQLLVGAAVDPLVTTYRRTWADGPRDRDVLRALDETLVAIEERTPAGTSS